MKFIFLDVTHTPRPLLSPATNPWLAELLSIPAELSSAPLTHSGLFPSLCPANSRWPFSCLPIFLHHEAFPGALLPPSDPQAPWAHGIPFSSLYLSIISALHPITNSPGAETVSVSTLILFPQASSVLSTQKTCNKSSCFDWQVGTTPLHPTCSLTQWNLERLVSVDPQGSCS